MSSSPAVGDGAITRRSETSVGSSSWAALHRKGHIMVLAGGSDYPLLDVMWTMFAFFMWFLWIWLLITIFSDMFRRQDLSGVAKGGWTVFVLLVPILGSLVYLIAQGRHMQERAITRQQDAQADFDNYVRKAASNGHAASDIGSAKELLDEGTITREEFETLKAK